MAVSNKRKIFMAAVMTLLSAAAAADDVFQREDPGKYWDVSALEKVPAFRDAPEKHHVKGVLRAVLIEGYGPGKDEKKFVHPYKPLSEKTKAEFFAYIGIPSTPMPKDGYPGIVMIHGGGGTAYPSWTKKWVDRGFVVISIDWYNQQPVPNPENYMRIAVGKEPLPGGKRQDHVSNVANMMLAHSLLLSMKEVNPRKTAFVGLSWGSWYGAILASLDKRFNGGVLIYCADKKQNRSIINGRFLHAAKIPLYWVVSTNDQNVNLKTLNDAFNECPTIDTKSIVIDLPHSHIGFDFDACFRMAEHYAAGDVPSLPKLSDLTVQGDTASCQILNPGKGIGNAVLCWTDDSNPKLHLRKWSTVPAKIEGKVITAKIPEKAHTFYISAYEGESRFHDLCGSTNPVFRKVSEEKK